MLLKSVYETQEEIPEQFVELFEERQGKWMLTKIEGMKTEADVHRIQESLNKERSTLRDAKQKLAAWGELDPADVHKQLDEMPELQARLADLGDGSANEETIQTRVDAGIRRVEAPLHRERDKLTADVAERDTTINGLQNQIRTKSIRDALREAATKNKVETAAFEDVMLRSPMFELDDDGAVVTKDGLPDIPGGMTADAWLAETRTKYSHWYALPAGAGAKGSTGSKVTGNPFTKGKFDSVAAQALSKSDPQKAAQLAKSAGFPGVTQAIRAGVREDFAAGRTKGI